MAWAGPGWVFAVNALTFFFPLVALLRMRRAGLAPVPRAQRARGQIREGLAYVRHRPDLVVIIAVVAVVAVATLNFQVTTAAMVRSVFGLGAEAYGVVSSAFAVGSLSGSLWAARRQRPRLRTVILSALSLGVCSLLLAAAPTYTVFVVLSVPVGLCVLTLLTSANQTVQLTTEASLRGRVMSIYMVFLLGSAPVGAPVTGHVADLWGTRAAVAAGGACAVLAAAAAWLWTRRCPTVVGGRSTPR